MTESHQHMVNLFDMLPFSTRFLRIVPGSLGHRRPFPCVTGRFRGEADMEGVASTVSVEDRTTTLCATLCTRARPIPL